MKLQWTWYHRYPFNVLFSFPLSKYPKMELVDHIVVLFIIFWGTSILFSIVTAPIYVSTNTAQWFSFLYILTITSCLFSWEWMFQHFGNREKKLLFRSEHLRDGTLEIFLLILETLKSRTMEKAWIRSLPVERILPLGLYQSFILHTHNFF